MNKNSSLGLAITSVGDLLLNKTITRNQENKAIKSIDLVVPNYQRPYKWTAKNVIQLLDDIIEAKNCNKETYRVGTLILHYDNEKTVYNIVDGQQRTITFSLLLNLLVIFLKPKALKTFAKKIFAFTSKGFSSKIPALLNITRFLGFNKTATFPP